MSFWSYDDQLQGTKYSISSIADDKPDGPTRFAVAQPRQQTRSKARRASAGTLPESVIIPVIAGGPHGDTIRYGPGMQLIMRCASSGCEPGSMPWSISPIPPGDKCYLPNGATTVEANGLVCSLVGDYGDCPKLGPVDVSSRDYSRTYDPKTLHKMACKYDPVAIAASCEATTAYINQRRSVMGDLTYFDDEFMAEMCSKQAPAESCPDKTSPYLDGNNAVVCSQMVACPMCKEWAASSTQAMDRADKTMSAWCTAHSTPSDPLNPKVNDPACKCISRGNVPIVKALGSVTDPLCWYKGCKDSGSYMLNADRNPSCGNLVCSLLNGAARDKGISGEDVKSLTECESTNPTPPGPRPEPEPNGGQSVWDGLDQNRRIVVIGGGAIIGIALIGLAYFMFADKKRS